MTEPRNNYADFVRRALQHQIALRNVRGLRGLAHDEGIGEAKVYQLSDPDNWTRHQRFLIRALVDFCRALHNHDTA